MTTPSKSQNKSQNQSKGRAGRTFRKVGAGGEIFKFDEIGDSIEGRLDGRREIQRKDGTAAIIYDIRDEGSKLWSVWGTAYLNSRMDRVEDGAWIRVTLSGTEAPKAENQDPMKIYTVEVAE